MGNILTATEPVTCFLNPAGTQQISGIPAPVKLVSSLSVNGDTVFVAVTKYDEGLYHLLPKDHRVSVAGCGQVYLSLLTDRARLKLGGLSSFWYHKPFDS